MKKLLMLACMVQGLCAAPELALVQQTATSAITTAQTLIARGSSNATVRHTVTGLALLGAGFLVTRPYVSARRDAFNEKTRADKLQLELESEKLRGQLEAVSRECKEQERIVAGLLAKVPTRRDLSGSEEELEE